jgi:hypothetical protein
MLISLQLATTVLLVMLAMNVIYGSGSLLVTGVLCFSDGIFLQVLEGGRSPVSALYNKIACDPRHHDVVLLSYEEVSERSFAGWSMGQVNLSRLNPALLLKYSERPELDPYAVSGQVSLALFNELVATAAVMGQC